MNPDGLSLGVLIFRRSAVLTGPIVILTAVSIGGASQQAPIEHLAGPNEVCLDCHDDLLEGSTKHFPAEDEGCDLCHTVAAAPDPDDVFTVATDDSPELCFECHDDVAERISEGVMHAILDGESCTLCHDPHSSDFGRLLNQPADALCGDCHDVLEQLEGRPVHHKPVVSPGCPVCHEPHAAPNPVLLRAATNDLCLVCHGSQQTADTETLLPVDPATLADIAKIYLGPDRLSGHPMVGHPVADPPQAPSADNPAETPPGIEDAAGPGGIHFSDVPAAEGAEQRAPLSCATCHEPHASELPDLMRSDPDLCRACHQ